MSVPLPPAQDATTTVSQLKAMMRQFVDERDWKQFHTPKNLSMSIAIEAAELMEHFQWLTPEQSRDLDETSRHEVGEELADVLCYAFAIANEMEIDIASTVTAKMQKNRLKYPAEMFHGRYGQKDLSQSKTCSSTEPTTNDLSGDEA